jgi:hypothetical protein
MKFRPKVHLLKVGLCDGALSKSISAKGSPHCMNFIRWAPHCTHIESSLPEKNQSLHLIERNLVRPDIPDYYCQHSKYQSTVRSHPAVFAVSKYNPSFKPPGVISSNRLPIIVVVITRNRSDGSICRRTPVVTGETSKFAIAIVKKIRISRTIRCRRFRRTFVCISYEISECL